MKTSRRADQGFSLLEVILAMSVLVIGALVTLTVMATTAQRNEKGKIDAIAYKSCQDMMEVLMSMPYADMANLKTWSVNAGQPLTFDVTAAGFPRQPNGSFVKGTYTLTDISQSFKIWEIVIRIDYQQVRVSLITLRKDPNY
jgi:prepilin-type N-terminal cleavage/methylation domain-containing protein